MTSQVLEEGHSANIVKQEKGEQHKQDLITKYSQLYQGNGRRIIVKS